MNNFNLIIEKYDWRIKVVFNSDCSNADMILEYLREIDCPKELINKALRNVKACMYNTGLTYSNINARVSIILISKTDSYYLFINTTSHEIYHLTLHFKKAISDVDEEELARITGDINMFIHQEYDRINSVNY